ncbi:MAG TPA: SxtJ family membrane protein [Steroidobacteraceae bacterium]|nr:SxtJ family membrane protein [Steroidobacteraceae bacterium]
MSTGSKNSGALADLTAHASGPERGSDRSFGVVFAIVFAIIAAWPLMKGGPVRLWAAAMATIFLILAVVVPRVLAPLNRLWMAFGLLLGRIISPIMLFLVYVIAVVPTGLIMRLLGKDPLHRSFDPGAKSYWVHRVPPGKPDATMTRQF